MGVSTPRPTMARKQTRPIPGRHLPGSYAYSYLSQSNYRVDRAVATYPSSGLATYEGKTLVNTGHTQAFVGDALIRVTWQGLTPATDTTPAVTNSTIVPIFSNFERSDNSTLDRLMHDGKVVDEIVFRSSAGDGGPLVLTHDGETGKLGITATADVAVTITYTDGTTGPGTAFDGETFMGKFVGSSGDGPLGVLGTWKVPGFLPAGNRSDAEKCDLPSP